MQPVVNAHSQKKPIKRRKTGDPESGSDSAIVSREDSVKKYYRACTGIQHWDSAIPGY